MSHVCHMTACPQVMAARHLVRPGRGIACPFVEVEVIGAELDNKKCKTSTVRESWCL